MQLNYCVRLLLQSWENGSFSSQFWVHHTRCPWKRTEEQQKPESNYSSVSHWAHCVACQNIPKELSVRTGLSRSLSSGVTTGHSPAASLKPQESTFQMLLLLFNYSGRFWEMSYTRFQGAQSTEFVQTQYKHPQIHPQTYTLEKQGFSKGIHKRTFLKEPCKEHFPLYRMERLHGC